MYIIECQGITKKFQKLEVLKGVDLKLEKGQFVSILGASGAGKSTLLHIIGTLEKADSGILHLFGQDISKSSPKDLASFRNGHMGFIFQFHHLLPEFTALENTALPGYIAKRDQTELHKEAKILLERLGLESRMHHKPGELSGGEQQRVALARALINKPSLLLADEPTGNLDRENAQTVLRLIMELRQELNMTVLLVTHDREIAQKSEYSLYMKDGLIVKS